MVDIVVVRNVVIAPKSVISPSRDVLAFGQARRTICPCLNTILSGVLGVGEKEGTCSSVSESQIDLSRAPALPSESDGLAGRWFRAGRKPRPDLIIVDSE
jgi:hypothetical protein